MACDLVALCIDAEDPRRLASFWAGVLGWPTVDVDGGVEILPCDDTGFAVRFTPTTTPKVGLNQMHFDLTSTSLDDQRQTVSRSLELGARHLDVGQGDDASHVVLEDPEGNEFCVIEPGNRFLADCGRIGALAGESSEEVGYFWSEALAWPLVWDQDQETAIRSPAGGPKLTWGGPPLAPKAGKYRLHFDLVPRRPGEQRIEIERLLSLGRPPSTSGRVTSTGRSWPIPTATSSACAPRASGSSRRQRNGTRDGRDRSPSAAGERPSGRPCRRAGRNIHVAPIVEHSRISCGRLRAGP